MNIAIIPYGIFGAVCFVMLCWLIDWLLTGRKP